MTALVLLLAAIVVVWSAIAVHLGTVIGEVIAARDKQIPTDPNRGW